jgi:hypothetical protein
MATSLTNKPTSLPQVLAWIAAVAFLASWFLPVLEDVPGWMAFRYALAPLVHYGPAESTSGEDAFPHVASALTNVVFIVLWALWLRGQAPRRGLFVRIAIASFALNLYWLVSAWRGNDVKDLLVGYYVWLAAFALLLGIPLTGVSSPQTSKTPTAGTPS